VYKTMVEGRQLDEAELVLRAQQGDAPAYQELMRMYEGVAFRTAYVIAGSATEAEEATHDAFAKAYWALGRFRRGKPFRPWLLTIVANEARNRRRSAGRGRALALRAADAVGRGDSSPSPEAAVLGHERNLLLMDAVNRLPEEQRLVVLCRYILDLGEAETASILGIRAGTVKSRLSRALDRLRDEVSDDG
jgi:RNA polymerase sigma-70 factor (ECF subfamily)